MAAANEKKPTTKFDGIFELLSVAENLLTNIIDNCSTEKKAATSTTYDMQWYLAFDEKHEPNSMEIYQMFEIIFFLWFFLSLK